MTKLNEYNLGKSHKYNNNKSTVLKCQIILHPGELHYLNQMSMDNLKYEHS